jgi:uncharacterized membrane protein YgcG
MKIRNNLMIVFALVMIVLFAAITSTTFGKVCDICTPTLGTINCGYRSKLKSVSQGTFTCQGTNSTMCQGTWKFVCVDTETGQESPGTYTNYKNGCCSTGGSGGGGGGDGAGFDDIDGDYGNWHDPNWY